MPITRFEIRNEYRLGDSELYRAADKDDPEALLEGVAMAGLVGLLRQLGDLAEFAAEIFHNLHEQVMATAARGHSLMIRVQQLEADVPSIERAFLSQTDHSSTFYTAGVDWHPNLHMGANLVTQGDLPRFVMDSYEECRPPPRLFLLDKFDVAGAGACLKRYTDPSFFKVQTDEMINADFQRGKRILKLRKKGPRWRNGETTEASHTKLHQLFLEERTENGVSKHSRSVKLKRRLNGFPFDSRTGRSYMEKILKSLSPEHEAEVYPLLPATSDENESSLEALQVRPVSPDRVSVGRRRSFHPSPDRKEIVLNPSIYEPAVVTTNDQIDVIPNSYHSFVTGGASYTVDKETAEKVIAVDAENNSEGYLTGYASSAVASEVENFVDATSILEAEMDTEAEFPMKNDLMAPDVESQAFVSDVNDEHQSTWISDCQSSGDSMLSDEGNSSYRKEMSGCSSSDYASTSAENQQSVRSDNRISSRDTPEIEMVVSSSYQSNAGDGFSVDQLPQTVACGDTRISTDAINCHSSDFEQRTDVRSNESIPPLVHSESEGVVAEEKSKQPEHDEMPSTMDNDEKKTNLATDQPFYPVSDIEFHSRDNSARFSAEHFLNEPEDEMVPSASTVPDIKSWNLLHDDGAARDDQNLAENTASTSNMLNAISQSRNDAPEMMPTTCCIPGESDDEGPELLEDMPSDYSDVRHNEDGVKSTVPQENLFSELGNEDSNGSTDGPTCSSDTMEASFGQKLNETLLANSQTLASENLEMSHLADSSDQPQADRDADEKDVLPEQGTAGNGTFALESPASYDVVGLHAGTIKPDFPSDSEPVGSSLHTVENFEEPAGTSDAVEVNEINMGISSTDLKSPNEAKVLVDEPDSEEERSNRDEVSTVCIISDDTTVDNTHLNVDLHEVEKELVHCPEDSGSDELENGKNSLSGSHEEAVGLVEEIGQMEAAALDSEAVLSNYVNGNHPTLEVSDAVLNSHPEFANATKIQSPELEVFLQRGLGNDVPDAKSVFIDYNTEELSTQEESGLPTNQELSHLGEITSESSSSLSSSHLQMVDHDDQKGDSDSAPALSLVDPPNPPSSSKLLSQSNHDVGVSGYPKDPLGSIYSPNNPSTESDKVNLADMPPLPPLPPVQWRMGKFQQDSASMEGGMIKHLELSPQMVAPLDASSDDVNSSLANTSTDDVSTSPQIASSPDDVSSSPVETSTYYVSLSHDEMTKLPFEEATSCPIQTAPKPKSEEEEAKNNCSILVTKGTCEAIDIVPNVEEKQPRSETSQLLLEVATHCPIQIPSKPEPKEEEAKISCSTLENKDICETVDAVTNIKDKQKQSEMTGLSLAEAMHGPIRSAPKPEPKEGEAKNICSILEIKDTHATIDVVPAIEQKQHQSETTTLSLEEVKHPIQTVPKPEAKEEDSTVEIKDMSKTIDIEPHVGGKPTTKDEFTSPEEDNELSHGSRKVKLPLPRNPLVEDVSVLDKSKLRKVTPRERPQVPKVDETDAFLEQIRNKSFNLKPAMASRPTIQQPKTNLRVAAILEKANAIRQALAGSDDDEDDNDDCWSDS